MSTADRPAPATAPPGDAKSDVIRDSPLPWEARGCRVCANGMPIADFNTRGDAAHAVAAANALPGLVEACNLLPIDILSPQGTIPSESVLEDRSGDVLDAMVAIRAALAALPEGVRP
jgi:hypothetical protein